MKKFKFVLLASLMMVLALVVTVYALPAAVTDDAYVNISQADVNFDTQGVSVASSFPNCTVSQRTYQQFDLAGVTGTIGIVDLGITASSATGDGNLEVWSVTDDTWDETTITWNNAPAPTALLRSWAKPGVGAANLTDNVNIGGEGALANFLEAERNGDGVASIAWQITGCTGVVNTVVFSDKEGANPPTITLQTPTAVDMVDTNVSNNNMALWAGIVVLFGLLTAGFVVVRKQGQTG